MLEKIRKTGVKSDLKLKWIIPVFILCVCIYASYTVYIAEDPDISSAVTKQEVIENITDNIIVSDVCRCSVF